jgi:hypothetical protein
MPTRRRWWQTAAIVVTALAAVVATGIAVAWREIGKISFDIDD